jgi:hypothetical protein
MQLEKFKPRDAVPILLEMGIPTFFKTWTLARLLGWICLDQRHGRREPNPKTGRSSNRVRFRDRNARLLGHLALACVLDRSVQPARIADDQIVRDMLGLFMTSGGFRPFIESRRGARNLLWRAGKKGRYLHEALKDLDYVHKITSYICRYNKYAANHSNVAAQNKLTLGYAKCFVENQCAGFRLSKISKIWERNNQAAPYIFAFYPVFSEITAQAHSIYDLVDGLDSLAQDQSRINELIGIAGHTADILAGMDVRNVRQKDFKKAIRVEPKLADFNDDELQMIEKIDPHELSEKDLQDYQPKPPKVRK